MKWILTPAAAFFLAVGLFAEDVRPDGTQAEAGTDCTTSDAHTATDNDTDDLWNTADDCIDDSCTSATDTTFVSQITFASPSRFAHRRTSEPAPRMPGRR